MSRGYAAIGLCSPKTNANVGSALRAAGCFGAAMVAVSGRRYGRAPTDALANCFGLTNLWGNSGEGWTYYRNARMTLMMAEPYLAANNKVGWLEFCELLRVGSA
jgi:hypothetical protein